MNLTTLSKIEYGMFIVSSKKGDRLNGQIVNTVFQISSNPATIAVSISKQNLTHEFISASRVFSVSILSNKATMPFIGRFGFKSGRDIDKFSDTKHRTGVTGAPIVLENCLAYMEAEVIDTLDVITHTLFIGKIVDAEFIAEGEPMTYSYYHKIKGGLTPKNAPTYNAKESAAAKEGGTKMKKYKCNVCGYIYDPAQGDPDGGIAPGTPFEQLPETWVCPVCGAPKSEFSPVE